MLTSPQKHVLKSHTNPGLQKTVVTHPSTTAGSSLFCYNMPQSPLTEANDSNALDIEDQKDSEDKEEEEDKEE